MKTKLSTVAFYFIICVFGFNGCTNGKMQIIHNDIVVTNNVPAKVFNDERYIWENWTYSTNRVESIESLQ